MKAALVDNLVRYLYNWPNWVIMKSQASKWLLTNNKADKWDLDTHNKQTHNLLHWNKAKFLHRSPDWRFSINFFQPKMNIYLLDPTLLQHVLTFFLLGEMLGRMFQSPFTLIVCFSIEWKRMVTETSSFVIHGRKQVIQVWNNTRVRMEMVRSFIDLISLWVMILKYYTLYRL